MVHNQNQRVTSQPTVSNCLSEFGEAYNPAQSGDGPAAKIWELLRRNPAFREDVDWMLNHSGESDAREIVSKKICALVSAENGVTRQFAGYVLRWFEKPVFLKPEKILKIMFGLDVAKVVKEDLVMHVFGLGISEHDDDWKIYRHSDIAQIMKVCPLYLLPAPNMRIDSNQDLWLKLILPDFLKDDYSEPLRLIDGNFNLDTPWPQTPKLFRDHFTWLWANFDASTQNPYTGDRKLLPRPASLGRFGEYNLQDQAAKLYPRLVKEFIYVVPSCFHTEATIKKVYSDFEARLSEEFRLLQISRKKYKFLFGAQMQWEAFIFVKDRTTYATPQDRKPFTSINVSFGREGSGKAIGLFEHGKNHARTGASAANTKGILKIGMPKWNP